MNLPNLLKTVLVVLFFYGCQKQEQTLFELLSPSKTGVDFVNSINDTGDLNAINYTYIYNGGGVAVGDINNDGLQDIFFTGNQVKDRLYLNEGNFRFKDITDKSGISNEGGWKTGVSMADVNGDGYLDFYVCRSGLDSTNRKNLLFINNGDLTFSEKGREFNLDDSSPTSHAVFFDFDNDGNLDVYIVNHPDDFINQSSMYYFTDSNNFSNGADKLFHNDGNSFTDVTYQAGIIRNFGYGLSASVTDVNDDGWMDLFVANDFFSSDLLYINNGNGTFSEKSKEYFKKTTLFSMGSDFGDINNDGLMDLMVVDMKPEGHQRLKQNHLPVPYSFYSLFHKTIQPKQYISNMLQLANEHGQYSEISELAGVARTDWSWAVLIQDFDNDGLNDIYISNGTKRDLHDMDFMMIMDDPTTERAFRNKEGELVKKMPSTLLPNYIYKNQGNLTFSNQNEAWGINQLASSSGAVYADLDNDGDLDLVVSNTDIPPFIYKNKTREMLSKNFLRIKLHGNLKNTFGINSKAVVYTAQNFQVKELSTVRGFQSSPEPVIHFGLDTISVIDSLIIYWLGGGRQVLENVKINQTIDVYQKDAKPFQPIVKEAKPIFASRSAGGLQYLHKEAFFNDFARDRLLQCKLSKEGPGIAVGDVNGDGRDDVYVGGAAGSSGKLFLQKPDGAFMISENQPWQDSVGFEEMGVVMVDFNNDALIDIYIASGSNEFTEDSPFQRDRIFLNIGNGKFKEARDVLPEIKSSSSCVVAADYNKDGFIDLFVGGRLIPGKYPLIPDSYLLKNNGGVFTEVTNETAPGLKNAGCVTSALWTDFNNDGWVDLIVVGEWMPVTFYQNINGNLQNITASTGISNSTGWWKSINGGDFDNDGDMDYIIGNTGLNSIFKASVVEPIEIFVNDFDSNGSVDPVIFHYLVGEKGPYADRSLFCEKMSSYQNKFFTYKSYANATVKDMFTENQIKTSQIFKTEILASIYLENLGGNQFKLYELPVQAQLAPVYGTLIEDFDEDGFLDVLFTGNSYSNHYNSGDYDAFRGLMLKGTGSHSFIPMSLSQSGIYNDGDGKALAGVYSEKENRYSALFVNNNDSLRAFDWNKKTAEAVRIKPNEESAIITFKNGKQRKVEFYNGAGYLSQSSRVIFVNADIKQVEIFSAGSSRIIPPGTSQVVSIREQ